MSEIRSPLGNKSVASQPRKILTVEDPNFDQKFDISGIEFQPGVPVELTPEQFNQMQAQRKQMSAQSKKPTSEAKQRIEILINIGRLTKEVQLEDHKYTLQSLKAREMQEVMHAVSKLEVASEVMFGMRAETLARSLCKIDDYPIGAVLGDDSLSMKLYFLGESEEHVINQLYAAYGEMVKEFENKHAIKNEKDAKEVVEEIKK